MTHTHTHTHTHVYKPDGARLDPVVRGAIEGVCASPWPSQASATAAEESERELDIVSKDPYCPSKDRYVSIQAGL